MTNELTGTNPARVRAPVIDEPLASAIAAHLRGAAQPDLRQAVGGFVARAKRTLTPPQDVIASLKANMQREAQPHMVASEFPRLVELVVGWGIEDYYRER